MSTVVRRALYGRMAGDTTLTSLLAAPPSGWSQNIFFEEAPEGAQYPFVIFSKSAGTPTESFGKPAALQTDVWLIKAIDRSTTADAAEAVAARVEALLNDAKLSIGGLSTEQQDAMYLRRQSDVQYSEFTEGSTYKHVGGNYRLIAEL